MDKERSQLELIKGTHVNMIGGNVEEYELVWTLKELLEQTDLALVYRQNIMSSVKWAIQQAERVEELEKTADKAMKAIDKTEAVRVKLDSATKEIERLKVIEQAYDAMKKAM